MSRITDSLRALAGDALIAAGEAVRGGLENLDYLPPDAGADVHVYGAMECDGPLLSWGPPALPREEVVAALDETTDSQLMRIVANILESWQPVGQPTDSALIAALRDRAAQFEAVEADADKPFLTPDHLVYQAYSPQHRDE